MIKHIFKRLDGTPLKCIICDERTKTPEDYNFSGGLMFCAKHKGNFLQLNCECKNPKGNDRWNVGEHEGRYERCVNCKKRLWS